MAAGNQLLLFQAPISSALLERVQAHGLAPSEATSLPEAVRMLADQPAAIIVAATRQGLELVRIARRYSRRAKLIVLTRKEG